jgi:hypothetical protein
MFEAGKVVLEAGAQIVQDPHVGPALKILDNMAANEPRTACDKNSHYQSNNPLSQFQHFSFLEFKLFP